MIKHCYLLHVSVRPAHVRSNEIELPSLQTKMTTEKTILVLCGLTNDLHGTAYLLKNGQLLRWS
jgi:hypothetical protein